MRQSSKPTPPNDFVLRQLLGPTIPLLGLNSTAPATQLRPGLMADCENLRTVNGNAVVRDPCRQLGTAGAGSPRVFYGSSDGVIDGAPTIMVGNGPQIGTVAPTGVFAYISQDTGATFSEITGASGPFGNTRFGADLNGLGLGSRLEFQVVKDRTFNGGAAYDCLIIQNGLYPPVIYAKAATNSSAFTALSYGTAIIYQPGLPALDGRMSYYTAFSKYFLVYDFANITFTNPTVNVTGAVGAGPMTITTATAHNLQTGDFALIAGVTGNTNANGYWQITRTGANTFTISPATGPGAYAGGGTVTTGTLRLLADDFGSGYWQGRLYPNYTNQTVKATFAGTIDLSAAAQFILMVDSFAPLAVTAATTATPIAVTTASAHNLVTGDYVNSALTGITGGTGYFRVTVTSATAFTLDGSNGVGAFASGTVAVPYLPSFWQYMKVSIGDNAAHTMVLYDPANGIGTPVFASNPQGSFIDLQQIAYPLQPTANFDLTHVQSVTFAWTAPPPPVEVQFDVYMAAGSGRFQGTSKPAVCYYGTDARSMGDATYYGAVVNGSTSLSGGAAAVSILGFPAAGITVADDSRFYYDYKITVGNTTTTDRDRGIDRALLFVQLPGQSQPYLCANMRMNHWNAAAWVYDSGGATDSRTFSYSTDFFTQDLAWPALDGAFQVMPIGLSMATSSQRMYVSDGKSTLWVSGSERPFQFRPIPLTDSTGAVNALSPTSLAVDGETIQELVDIGSLSGGNEDLGNPSNGVSTVFIFTDRTLSWITGWDSTSLGKRNLLYNRGTYAPKSVARSRTGFMFLDTDLHVVSVDGYVVTPLSRDIIDDRLQGIPASRIPWIWAMVRQDRYYMAYTPSGATTNTKIAIYDVHESQRLGIHLWLSDTMPSALAGASSLMAYRNGAYTQIIGFDYNDLCFEHEQVPTSVAVSGASFSGLTVCTVTTASPHNLQTGNSVFISGVLGNTNANGQWYVQVLSATQFTLLFSNGNTREGNAVYTGGGTVLMSNDAGTSQGIAWTMTFPEINNGLWKPVRVRRFGVVCDSGMADLVTLRTSVDSLTPTASSGIIQTDPVRLNGGSRAIRWDVVTQTHAAQWPGINGVSVLLTLSSGSPSRHRLYNCLVEVSEFDAQGADSSTETT